MRATEVVRQPVRVQPSSRRKPIERFGLRFPGLTIALTRLIYVFGPSSPVRRAAVRYFARVVVEAANRGDFEAAFVLIPDDYESETPEDLVGLGFDATYRGREGRLRFQQQWMAELGDFQQELEEVIDTGDQILLVGRMHGVGTAVGAAFDSEVVYLITVAGGRLRTERSFRFHAEAFEAAGIPRA